MTEQTPPNFAAVRFDVEAVTADAWSDALLDAGASSVDAADPDAGTARETAVFAEGGGQAREWWPISRLTALFEPGRDPGDALATAARALGLRAPSHQRFDVADRDWIAATRSQFTPIRIAEDLWIVPTWCEPPRRDAVNVVLDPGLAFGTGSHPTTGLCLAWLRETVTREASVLDYGCGSGILAIAALKLGAVRACGIDIDPQAVQAGAFNAGVNGVVAEFGAPGRLGARRFDVVVANILANPLRLLAPLLAAHCSAGGRIALSGILEAQADDVIAAYSPWFTMTRWRGSEGWVLLAGVLERVPA
ncbi:MAG TPA: 50S ribosomal protein L11 methyltransferase [Casimicrobiaceae bacterium]|nr:50S ribosomal protein L11 methyltransferase [Casimicrobiaceae bacterium]